MVKTGVIIPAKIDRDDLFKRISSVVPEELSENDCYYFSNVGSHFEITRDITRPSHIYSPLNVSFGRAFIGKEFPVLYANDFTVCWLACMLFDMGEGGELWLEIADEKANERRNQLTSKYLIETLSGAQVVRSPHSSHWLRITDAGGLASDIHNLKTIYRFLHNKFDVFEKVYSSTNGDTCIGGNTSPDDKALRTYIYSLFGANQKSFVIEKVLHERVGSGPLKGIDIGGGYGFMAAELAVKGHHMTMVDHSPVQVNVVGKWLVEQCHLQTHVTLKVDTIENTPNFEGEYDFVCYFGCLLAIDRKHVPSVLRGAMKLLRPGGALLIHEGPKEAGKPGTLQYEERFEADELYAYLVENAGEPVFYNMFTGNVATHESIKRKLIMAVIGKEG